MSSAGVARMRPDGATSSGRCGDDDGDGDGDGDGDDGGDGEKAKADGLEDDWARPAVCPCDVMGVLSGSINPFPAVGDLQDIMNEQGQDAQVVDQALISWRVLYVRLLRWYQGARARAPLCWSC